jgi:hypothetical protein
MKAKPSKVEDSKWVMHASKLLKRIKAGAVPVLGIFSQQEHLQPLDNLTADRRAKVAEFLGSDPALLVPVTDLEAVLKEAVLQKVPEGQILHAELRNLLTRVSNLRTTIGQFAALGQRTYAEAKAIFAEVISLGIWIEEATLIRKIIQVNKKIETLLSENDHNCLIGLREISENEGKFIDSMFKKIIASRFQEISQVQKKLDRIFSKPSLEIEDFQPIERLVKECKNYPFFIPNNEMLYSLYRSFVWVLELGAKFDLKTSNLTILVNHLITRIRNAKENGELKDKREKLGESSKFTYVQQPISKLVHECRFLLWDSDVKSYLARPLFKKDELKMLLEKAPTTFNGHNGPPYEFLTVKKLVERGKLWEAEVERIIRQTTELRTCQDDVFKQRMSSSVGQIEEAISKAKEEYKDGLKQIEEFHSLKGALDLGEKILIMSKCVYKIANAKKIDHSEYLKAKELFKDQKCKEFHKDHLFLSFRRLLLSFNNEVKLLKDVYLKIVNKESHATPDLFEPKFLEYAKELYKADAAYEAITKVENFIQLGEFGTVIKSFIADFKAAESSLLVLYNDHPYSELSSYDATTLQEIIEEFSARKQKWRVRLFSYHLVDLARYEWLLHSLCGIASPGADLEDLERLLLCSEVAIQDDRPVVAQLQKKIAKGRELVEEIQAVLSCRTALTIDDLKLAKRKLEDAQVTVKGVKKQISIEYMAYEMLEADFLAAQRASETHCMCSLDELKVLLKEALALKYKAPLIEKILRNAISVSEKLLHKIAEHKPHQEVIESIQAYRETEFMVQEIEVILRNREIALEFLHQDEIPIEKMNHRELKILEKSIINSLDLSFNEKYGQRILKRKFNLLYQLEKKGQDPGDENKIKMKDLIELSDEMKKKQSLFSMDDLDYIQEKMSQSKLYIEHMKRVKEETLKKSQKVLFNFLDISDEIKQISKTMHQSSSVLDRVLKHHPEQVKEKKKEHLISPIVANSDLVDKNDRKIIRKEKILLIRNCILSILAGLSKPECAELARTIESAIYSGCKSNLTAYSSRTSDYIELLEKVQLKTFLVELFISRPLPSEIVSLLLQDDTAEFEALPDLAQARRYIRSLEVSACRKDSAEQQTTGDRREETGSGEEDGRLGKRGLPVPFLAEELDVITAAQKRAKDWSEQKSAQCSAFDGISLDRSATDARKTFAFAARAKVVDMEEIDDSSDPGSAARSDTPRPAANSCNRNRTAIKR